MVMCLSELRLIMMYDFVEGSTINSMNTKSFAE